MAIPSLRQRGASMIEVLVTIVIIAFGLLGMAGLQSRLQVSEMEAYQRAQALVLLNDMASRIATNRNLSDSYVTEVGMTKVKPSADCAADFAGATILKTDAREWCNALQGAAEISGTNRLGAVIGGRGCVESLGVGTREYMITVAWQGNVPLNAPPASVACGKDLYDLGGTTGCTADRCRRVVTTIIRIAPLMPPLP
jgi:type IV pilus assembly protein PilV